MNNLSDEEARQLHLTIKDLMCEAPFACGMILSRYAYRTSATYVMDTGYIEPKSEYLPSDTFEERLISL